MASLVQISQQSSAESTKGEKVTAQEIRKPRVLANFRPSIRERKTRVAPSSKRAHMSDAHLALIRLLPCCVTGRAPAGEAHHLKAGTGERGVGRRSSDRWAVPLCHAEHMDLESKGSRNEPAWFRDRGVADPLGLASALWAATGDIEKMRRIVVAHMGTWG